MTQYPDFSLGLLYVGIMALVSDLRWSCLYIKILIPNQTVGFSGSVSSCATSPRQLI